MRSRGGRSASHCLSLFMGGSLTRLFASAVGERGEDELDAGVGGDLDVVDLLDLFDVRGEAAVRREGALELLERAVGGDSRFNRDIFGREVDDQLADLKIGRLFARIGVLGGIIEKFIAQLGAHGGQGVVGRALGDRAE